MPDNATPIEAISLNFYSDNKDAVSSIDRVIQKLTALQTKVSGVKLSVNVKGVKELAEGVNSITEDGVNRVSRLAEALERLSNVTINSDLPSFVSRINKSMGTVGSEGVNRAAEALENLSTITEGKEFEFGKGTLTRDIETPLEQLKEMATASETAVSSATTGISGLLTSVSSVGTGLGQIERDIQQIAEGTQQYIAFPIESYFTGANQAISQLSNGISEIIQQMLQLKGVGVGGATVPLLPAVSSRNNVLDNIDMSKAVADFAKSGDRPLTTINTNLTETESLLDKIKGGMNYFATEVEVAFLSASDSVRRFRADLNATASEAMNSFKSFTGVSDGFLSGKGAFSGFMGSLGGGIGKIAKIPLGIWAKQFTALGSAVSGATTRLFSFFGSIKRIATYRLIRMALKLITQGFKEGITNLYEWSKKFDSTKEFANSLDKIATAALYVKNSLAAMVAPIINALAPALDWLADKFVSLLNVINEFFAALTGADTYTVAKKVATEFKDISDGASKATKAVKSFTIGIDELNIIEESKSSGSGTGGSSNVAENWFKKETVSTKMKDFIETIKKMIKQADWVGIGTLLGQEANKLVDKIPWGALGTKAGKLFTAAFTIGTSFLDTFDATKLGSNMGTSVNNFFSTADFSKAGEFFSTSFFKGVDFIGGFLGTIKWGEVTKKISNFFTGGMRKAKKWFESKDWTEVGSKLYQSVKDALNGLEITDLISSGWDLLTGVTKATIDVTVSFISSWGEDIGNWFYDLSNGQLPDAGTQPLQFIVGGVGADIIEGLVYLAKNGYIDEDLNITVKSVDEGMYNIGEKTTPLAPGAAQFLPDGSDGGIDWRGQFFSIPSQGIEAYATAFENLSKGIKDFKDAVKVTWDLIKGKFEAANAPLDDFIDAVKENIGDGNQLGIIGAAFDLFKTSFETDMGDIKYWLGKASGWFDGFGDDVSIALGGIPSDLAKNWDKVSGKLRYIKAKVELESLKLWNAVKSGFKLKVNQFIDLANSALTAIFKALNKVASKIDKMSDSGLLGAIGEGAISKLGSLFATAPQIPKLAKGGVIKPNKEFLALLGDQKSGTNIEAPLSTIKQAVGEEIRKQYDAKQIAMPDLSAIVGEIQRNVNNDTSVKTDTDSIKKFLEDSVIPLLSNIATDTKRQADKNEKTEVVMDSRRVAESVNKQNRANGYSFVR